MLEAEHHQTVPADSEAEVVAETDALDGVTWPRWKRVGFRFLASYFLLYTLPFPLTEIPWAGGFATRGVRWLWERAAIWLARHGFGIEEELFLGPTGSGDTTFDYLRLLLMLALAVLITFLWSWIDHRRGVRAYPRTARWLVVGCSFYLGITLLSYGIFKVIPTQFSTPRLTRLLQPYGTSSPMGIVWTFMGLSPAYTIFSGFAEAIPGFMLFFRRTRLLGALLAVAVMTNVVMINYCFDVPVKLFSSHLLVMAIGLTLLDGRRLVAFFVRNRPAPPADYRPLFESRLWNRVAAGMAFLLVATFVVMGIRSAQENYELFGAGRPKPEIWGIHDVESFQLDGEERPPLLTDETRWRALVVDDPRPLKFGTFERPGRIAVQQMNGELDHLAVELDVEGKTLTVLPEGQMSLEAAREAGEEVTTVLRYERPEPGLMILRGTLEGQPVEITLRERDLGDMLLISRGYRWINEYPFNR